MPRWRLIVAFVLTSATAPMATSAPGPAGPEVIFLAGKGGANCTAVWIASNRVLTAGHCVGARGDSVFWKANGTLQGGCVLARHGSKDLALIASVSPAPAAIPLVTAGLPSGTIQIAGFSIGAGWQGDTVVQSASTSVIRVDSATAPTADLPCFGDSGGPAYAAGKLVGIGHRIVSPFSCSTDAAEYTFVGNESGWVKGFSEDSGCRKTLESVLTFLSSQ
jgi:hypothetical protein